MAWFGKFVGGVIGFAIGGPIGAVAGAALGHGIDKNSPSGAGNYNAGLSAGAGMASSEEKRQSIFFVTVFACLGKIAKADGTVTREELQLIEEFVRHDMGLNDHAVQLASKIFYEAANSDSTYDEIAQQFYDVFKNERDVVITMMELQFKMAMADGEFHANEEKLLLKAKGIFQVRDDEYAHIRSRFLGDFVDDVDSYYAVLGCNRNDSMETIKSKYRKLIQDYHPDKIISKGLPEEFVTFANSKFGEIKAAYEMIKKSRNSA